MFALPCIQREQNQIRRNKGPFFVADIGWIRFAVLHGSWILSLWYGSEHALGASDVIAVLAALVAGLSALYARWAAEEAKRANELALLAHRKAIYDAFYELKMHMEQRGFRPDMEQVSKFYYPSRDAAFYVKESLSSEIAKYFELCFKVADLARLGNGLYPKESEEVKDAFKQAREISEEIDSALKAAVKKYAANG